MDNVKRDHNLLSFDKRIIVLYDPRSPEAESFRSLRTNILRSDPANPPKVLTLVSAHPAEGKSITSVNLAITMAETGKKTLLIDCDLRRPSIHTAIGMEKEKGLSDILYGTEEWDKVLKSCGVENLSLITSGALPHNPAEIIGSDKFKLFLEEIKNVFDVILLDAPCILAVTDGLILSALGDAVLFVIMAEKTPREAVLRTITMLKEVKSNILGVIFNKVNLKRSHYYYYYYYGTRKKR